MISSLFIILFSSISFLFYGMACLGTAYMESEFNRYGLSRYRKLTGVLEILGAVGLLAGILNPVLGVLAAAGLSLLMLAGLGVRVRIGDGLLRSFPALMYLLLNLYIIMIFTAEIIQR